MNKKPIFEIIADRLRQTEFKDDDIITLGKDFSLPSDENMCISYGRGRYHEKRYRRDK